jgi:hypothetical protein
MKPMAAAAIGALISGIAMFAVGARAQQNPFAEMPALVQTVDGQFIQIPNAKPVGYSPYASGFQSAAPAVVTPVAQRRRTVPTRTVYRTAEPVQERVVVEEAPRRDRSWGKTALIVGGSAASGAGVGAILGGKKGALAGAAIGGGAASIYESTRRR